MSYVLENGFIIKEVGPPGPGLSYNCRAELVSPLFNLRVLKAYYCYLARIGDLWFGELGVWGQETSTNKL